MIDTLQGRKLENTYTEVFRLQSLFFLKALQFQKTYPHEPYLSTNLYMPDDFE
jgi:hypothetical protein